MAFSITAKDDKYGETGLKVIPTDLEDLYRLRYLSYTLDDGKYYVPKIRSDDMALLEAGIVAQRTPLSAYYSVEYNDKIYHVFNAERVVNLFCKEKAFGRISE